MNCFARPLIVACASLLFVSPAEAKIMRSASAKSEFKRLNPCPATQRPRGACPGYIIDHIKPLACKGADDPSNMQWQTKADAKAKDRVERRQCRP